MLWDKSNLPPAVKNKNWSKPQIKAFISTANAALEQYKDDGKAIAVGIHAADNLDNSLADGEAVFKKVPFIEAGLVNYDDLGLGTFFIKKETLDNMVKSLRGKPVIINHSSNIDSEDIHGYVTNVLYNDKDGQYYAEFMLHTQEGKEAADKLKFGSCSYAPEYAGKNGIHNAMSYDDEIVGGEFTHLALVDRPRYENARILNNSIKEKQMTQETEKSIMDKITELFNARFPSKTEAKEDHVVKIGEKELTVKEIKDLINSMDEKKKAKKDKKKAKKALKNAEDEKPEEEATEPCSKKDKKKAKKEHENSFSLDEDVVDKSKEMELFNNLNMAKDKAKPVDMEIPEDVYMTEKAGYNLAKKMGI